MAERPAPDPVEIHAPQPLKAMRNWLVWKYEPDPDRPDKKPRKVPYWIGRGRRHGLQGSEMDRAGMGTFEEALVELAAKDRSGLGFAPFPEDGVVALDFDDCIDEAGQVDPRVLELVAGTYAEVSPSGRGVRAFFRGHLPDMKSTRTAPGELKVEVFGRGGFVTVTGNVLPVVRALGDEDTVAGLTDAVQAFLRGRFGEDFDNPEAPEPGQPTGEPLGLTAAQLRECLEVLPDDLEYDEWVEKTGMPIHHETRGSKHGFEIWHQWNKRSKKHTSRAYDWARWVSFGKPRRDGRPQVTARSLVRLAGQYGARIDIARTATADDFEDVSTTEAPAEEATKKPRFPVYSVSQFLQRPSPRWIVKGILADDDFSMIVGEPGSGKSFIAIDMSVAIATGEPWFDRTTRRMRVVYIAAEGVGGVRNRVAAQVQERKLDPDALDIGVIDRAPNLLLKEDAVALARSIREQGGAELIVVDTLAQVTPGGNENSGEDMGKVIEHVRQVARHLGARCLAVHHLGKDATRGARGWSGLNGAAGSVLLVERSLGAVRSVRITKQKDGEDGLAIGFELQPVEIGTDEDDLPITSCVVIPAELPTASASLARRLGPLEQVLVRVIEAMGEAQSAGIETSAVIDEAAELLPPPEGGRDTRKQRLKRALRQLVESPGFEWIEEDGCLSRV